MGLELSPILYVTNSINVISNGTFSTVCSTLAVSGCTDSTADNFEIAATEDDGSCIYTVYGCTDSTACNYDILSTENDGHVES